MNERPASVTVLCATEAWLVAVGFYLTLGSSMTLVDLFVLLLTLGLGAAAYGLWTGEPWAPTLAVGVHGLFALGAVGQARKAYGGIAPGDPAINAAFLFALGAVGVNVIVGAAVVSQRSRYIANSPAI